MYWKALLHNPTIFSNDSYNFKTLSDQRTKLKSAFNHMPFTKLNLFGLDLLTEINSELAHSLNTVAYGS
jgi:hypothetical protein